MKNPHCHRKAEFYYLCKFCESLKEMLIGFIDFGVPVLLKNRV